MAVRFWHSQLAAEACGCSQKQIGDGATDTRPAKHLLLAVGRKGKTRFGQGRGAGPEWTVFHGDCLEKGRSIGYWQLSRCLVGSAKLMSGTR